MLRHKFNLIIMIKQKKTKKQTELAKSKRIIFSFVLVTLPVMILAIFELFLRFANYGDNFDMFINLSLENYPESKIVNPEIGKKYFAKFQYPRPRHDMFLKEKSENSIRIFVLGSSTVFGFPYEENLTLSKILHNRLQDSYPDKQIEMINTALTAINSYTLLDFIDDVLKAEPDAILIYAGHNEFYGAFGTGSMERANKFRWLTILHLDLLSFRSYQLLRNMMNTMSNFLLGDHGAESLKGKGTLMKLIADRKEIAYKGEIYNAGINIFRNNMGILLSKAAKKKVPVFISEVVSNVRDLPPFCSVVTDSYPPASEVFDSAKKFDENRDFNNAKENYELAKDLDGVRFRASEEINEIIHDVAGQYHATLVPMQEYFEQASPNRLIGNNLITEHVHPNIDGYFLMADAFYQKIVDSKLIGDRVEPIHFKNSNYYKNNWAYTDLDSLIGVHKVNSLRSYWPFQPVDNLSPDYLDTYTPVSMVDSLAFDYVKCADSDIHGAHIKMAEFYKAQGDYYKAFKEYYAAIKNNPFYAKDYLEAARCLMFTNDFSLALQFFDQSLQLQETFYAYYNKSEILFLMGDYAEAIQSLNKALALEDTPESREEVLKKKHKIYFYSGNKNKTSEILVDIRKIDPGYQPAFPATKKSFPFLIPVQVKDQVDKAYGLYKSGKYDQALTEFLLSLEIKETPLANRCVGDILFSRNNGKAILYYQRAYPGYKFDVDFLVNLAILYVQNKLEKNARNTLNEIKQLDPGNEKIPLLEENIRSL
ncbi:tetratricopeptide repeat protein [candidate division KSB1 bacterium]|nr:MAG: tetratricopeptide repeat protein [candidate division KSB1 bacterium]